MICLNLLSVRLYSQLIMLKLSFGRCILAKAQCTICIMDFISRNCQSLINEINFNYLEVMFMPSEQPR